MLTAHQIIAGRVKIIKKTKELEAMAKSKPKPR